MSAYAELQVTTNFSFLRGGAHPDELVKRAKALGLAGLAVTDRNTLAGVVRAHMAAKAAGLAFIVGARLDLEDGPSCLAYPTDRQAYGRLARLISLGQRRAEKGACRLTRADVLALAEGQIFAVIPPEDPSDASFRAVLMELRRGLEGPLYLVAHRLYRADDRARLAALAALARRAGTPLLATNDVHYHDPARRPLQDVLTCIREGTTINQAGLKLAANAERHLKGGAEMARLFSGYEDALARGLHILKACRFSLDELRYEYPEEPVPAGLTAQAHLEASTWQGAAQRYPQGVPAKVAATLRHELTLIAQLNYAPYFLTVHDIVHFARSRGILCQGRGSAANSAVCFCLGITAVDPSEIDLLFERFVSIERKEPPDIDVDFEHERREEVIQFIYARYGREKAGIAATVITYRARSAIREVGKAMGLSEDVTATLANTIWGSWSDGGFPEARVREAGLDPNDPYLRLTLTLAEELHGFPRHLSQHVGGFVLTRGPLCEVVPIGNAAMADRTFIEWDKDDLDALGILKIDVLGLGMLTCIRKAFELLSAHAGIDLDLARVPAGDPAVYDMLCRGDSIGVFQVESRAQMNMLPRLKPRTFYDLVIEVAIVRPGPIQGDMVHPYLRRRSGLESVSYPKPGAAHGPPDELEVVLKKTLGVPLFQEQAMRIAIEAAKFTPSEANELRHAMATFRRRGTINMLRDKFVNRMVARGYAPELALRCFKQIEGFGEYGFPESHAASFALLVYVSAWLKHHHPAAFACALLNAQPMGFYAPAQIVRDAREHGVIVHAVDVNHSVWDNSLEPEEAGLALRLGLRQVDGFREDDAARLLAARRRPYRNVPELARLSTLKPASLARLAAADAFRSLGLDRRQALWAVRGLEAGDPLPLFAAADAPEAGPEPQVELPRMPLSAHVVDDYRTLRLSLKAHPLTFLRASLEQAGALTTASVQALPDGRRVRVGGIVLVRQRPGSAKGVVFMTIEDETGIANAVVWPKTLERYRRAVIGARLVLIDGRIQRHEAIVHVVVERIRDESAWLNRLADDETPLRATLARADEVGKTGREGTPSPNAGARHPRYQRIIPRSRDFH